jgi:hypothetical protein
MALLSLPAKSACANPQFYCDGLLLDALRRWKAAVIAYQEDPRDGESPEWLAMLDQADAIVAEIADLQAAGIDGLAIKLYFSLERDCGLVNDGSFNLAWNTDRIEAFAAPALRDAMRLAPEVAKILGLTE